MKYLILIVLFMGCDFAPTEHTHLLTDCAGVAGGSAVLSGCDNLCNSTAVEDDCGICGGDNSLCTDCAGVSNGDALVDNCGTCDADVTNDCTFDCEGIWGGSAVLDMCGTCDSDATNDCPIGTYTITSFINYPLGNGDCIGDAFEGFCNYENAIEENCPPEDWISSDEYINIRIQEGRGNIIFYSNGTFSNGDGNVYGYTQNGSILTLEYDDEDGFIHLHCTYIAGVITVEVIIGSGCREFIFTQQ